jgi:YDG domain/MBG domain (YGX type)
VRGINKVAGRGLNLFIILAILGAILPTAAFASEAPSIGSDKGDYAPGELVTLTGSGWQPSESVHIEVNDDLGRTWSRNVDVSADESGNIRDEFNLPDWFVATYRATASGTSGIATTSFTDGNLRIASSGPTFTATWRKFNTNASCSGAGDSGGTGTVTSNPGQSFAMGVDTGQSLRVQIPATAGTPSQNFSHWSGEATGTNLTICLAGFGNGTRTATANYVLPDTSPPNTTITDGPSGTVTSSSATFTFTSTETGSTFQCGLDGASFTDCSSPKSFTDLGVQTHTFSVRAIDAAGNVDPTAASRSWTVAPAPTSLSISPVTGTFGGSASLSATLTSSGSPVSGMTVNFTLNGSPAGSAITNASGAATLSNSLAGINVGTYPAGQASGVGASFAGDSTRAASSGSGTLTVNPKAVTVTADDQTKTYGGDDPAFSHEVSGLEPGDSLSGVGCVVTEPHANVGDYEITCSGNTNSNYSVTYVSGTLTVNPKALTGGFSAADKVYDGTTSATVASRSLPGVLEGDEVSLDVTNAQFDNKNVGQDKTVTADLSLSGAQAGNYSLSSATAGTEASITVKSITGGFSVADKVYDGTVDASITDRWLTGAVFGDDVSLSGGTAIFASPLAGNTKTVTGAGFSLSGTDAANYTLMSVASTTANISPAFRPQGFYNPVDMGGVYNTVKGGSTVPLKFEVFRAGDTTELSDTSIVNQPLMTAQINCSNGAEDSIESLASTNGNGLRYDVTGGQFIFNWQTPKKPGACYRVTVETKDGSSISALFKLK